MKKIALCMLVFAFLSGCMTAPVMPPAGLLFEDVKAPLDVDMEQTKVSSKSGKASSYSVLWLFAFGDCSIATAAQKGNIKVIESADYEYTTILLGLFQSFTIIVHGE